MIYIVLAYLVFKSLFNQYSEPYSTNWSILYYSIHYSLFLIICLREAYFESTWKHFHFLVALLLGYYILGEVVCLDMPYNEYRAEKLAEGGVPVWSYLVMLIFYLFYLYKSRWQKHY